MVASRILNFFKSRAALGFAVASLLGFMGVSSAFMLSDPTRGPLDPNWERIQETGVIVVGVDPSIPPFAEDTPQGPIGLDPAIAEELARRLGVEVRYVLLSFDGLYDTLLLGYADLVIAALRPDPLRTDRTRYTVPYFDGGHVLVSQTGYQNLNELAGKTVAAEFASEGDLAARQVAGVTIERYFTATEAINAVMNGKAAAALVDYVSASQHPKAEELQLSKHTLIADLYVMAIRRSDWRLYEAVQAELIQMQQDGTLDKIKAEWLTVGG
jgi:ABC-type amino acid transport substrate-binding protein